MTPTPEHWIPQVSRGTWHPMGNRHGPVLYEQRINGSPTGLYFLVSRARHLWISTLVAASTWPLMGRVFRRLYQRITVVYRWAGGGPA